MNANVAKLFLPDGREYTQKGISLGVGVEGLGPNMAGDATVSSVVAAGQSARAADLDVYNMLRNKHPIVAGCVTLIRDAVGSDGWDIAPREHEDAKPISADEDPRVGDIRAFFDLATPKMTDRGRRQILADDVKTYGFAALRKKRAKLKDGSYATLSNGARVVAGLERIDPRTLTVRPNKAQTKVEKYLVRKRQADGLFRNTDVEEIDPKDVVFISENGGDPMQSFSSPLEALDLSLATDFAQRRFREAFCRSGAKAGLILTSDTFDEDAFKAAKAEIEKNRAGADNAFKTMLLPGGWKLANVAKAGQDDADFVKAAALNREDVCSVYKVPVGMLTFSGSAIGSAGKDSDRDFFEQFAVLPVEEILYERLTISILHDEFGISDLEMVPKRRNRVRFDRFNAAALAVKFGATGNEARRFVNLPPVTDDRYDMDAPLFIGASNKGVIEDEPLHPSDNTGLPDQGGAGDASASADAAQTQHRDGGE